jgi:N-methylhydantoinase A
VIATLPVARPELKQNQPTETVAHASRQAHFDGTWYEVDVLTPVNLSAGLVIEGSAIVEFPEATCVVRPGWSARVDDVGALVLERT